MGALLDAHAAPEDAFGEADPEAGMAQALRALKREAGADAPDPAASARMWEQIEERLSTRRPSRRPLRLVRSSRRTWLYLAAAVLVVAVVSWLLRPRVQDPVLVASAGARVVTYAAPDGSVVTLRPHSALYRLPSEAAGLRFRLSGEAFFAVTPDTDRPFAVEANDAVVTVLGTQFNVSTWGVRTVVYLDEGRVRLVHAPTEASVVLEPGQRVVVTEAGVLAGPEPQPAAEYLDWMRGELTFAQQPLDVVLAEVAHHYDVSFDVPPALARETLTGTLRLDGLDQTLTDLGTALGGRFEQQEADTYAFVPE